MKTLRYFMSVLLLGAAVSSAHAHDQFSFGISIGNHGYHGYPAVGYLAPPPVVYHAAPHVYYSAPHIHRHAPMMHNVYRGHHFDNYRPHHGGHGHHRGHR